MIHKEISDEKTKALQDANKEILLKFIAFSSGFTFFVTIFYKKNCSNETSIKEIIPVISLFLLHLLFLLWMNLALFYKTYKSNLKGTSQEKYHIPIAVVFFVIILLISIPIFDDFLNLVYAFITLYFLFFMMTQDAFYENTKNKYLQKILSIIRPISHRLNKYKYENIVGKDIVLKTLHLPILGFLISYILFVSTPKLNLQQFLCTSSSKSKITTQELKKICAKITTDCNEATSCNPNTVHCEELNETK